jgi:hypothetical protein
LQPSCLQRMTIGSDHAQIKRPRLQAEGSGGL